MLHAENAQVDSLPVATIEGHPNTGTFFVKPLMRGDTMALLEVRVRAGVASPVHEHSHESLIYVVSGRVKILVNDEAFVLGPGDVCRHPRAVGHRVEALEDTLFVEVKSPPIELSDVFGLTAASDPVRDSHVTEVSRVSVNDQKRTIEQWAVQWSAHDLERLLPLFTEDVVYEDVTMGAINRGVAELRAFAQEVFARFPDVTFELQSSFTDGTRGGAEWVMRGARNVPGMPAGQRVEVRGASIFEFAGDKIRRCADYWDMATYLRQLGLTASA